MLKIYVVEVVLDYVEQVGFSLSKKKAEQRAKELNKKNRYREYFVTEYSVKDNADFCEFADD